ncbi:DUF3667 domain-containing protein [Flavobacterium sp. Sd200]|uniref:DUF3667 domain-containing protein n=1 Tax=Flavobacterium sp. Sd200 TaxID=2692211 RepID=UPI00136DBD4E|nr:DUF3667 domain-containing protein [Flavobacterium sp. Sd200]MXN90530.1 DUF3667 domain-containing protein [Flavobacterium sp. Sd200]
MGHDKLRNDTVCQNCGHTVEQIFCTNCGQKNIETRQSFHHLITHFAEDLTHYDSGFWRTIKALLFNPAKLTKEYLAGKRQIYVPPVKLYIFISFVTFLLLSFMPKEGVIHESKDDKHNNSLEKEHTATKEESFSSITDSISNEKYKNDGQRLPTTIAQLDSIKEHDKNMNASEYWLSKKAIELRNKDISWEKVNDTFFHTLPKILFIYMPIFAFWLWLFHGKKRWLFFDHGIYTLHYFSLLLLVSTINMLISIPLLYVSEGISDTINSITVAVTIIYTIFYFFRSHSRMYGERKLVSRLKGIILFFINLICIIIVLLLSLFYSALNAH